MNTKCIYKITNMINGKIYIGQSVDFKQRWRQHKKESLKELPSMIINQAMKKHGIDNFIFEVISSIIPIKNEIEYCKIADELEEQFIKEYQSHISLRKGYNVSRGGMTSPKSEEWKQYMSNKIHQLHIDGLYDNTLSGYQLGHQHSEETLLNMSKSLKGRESPMKNKSHTEEAKEKNRLSHIGKSHEGNKNFKHTEEAKIKIGIASKGNKYCLGKTPYNKGISPSIEAKEKMSEAQKIRFATNKQHNQIGDKPLTNAEKQKRYREKKKLCQELQH